jgi:hypothetical protein
VGMALFLSIVGEVVSVPYEFCSRISTREQTKKRGRGGGGVES